MTARPPGPFERLLRRTMGKDRAGLSVVGDLREEYEAACGRWPRWRAKGWYGITVVALCLRIGMARAVRRLVGLGGGEVLLRLRHDLRYGMRALLGSPVFTVVSVLTIAIGIGATTSIYSVVHGVLIEPLPLGEPDRLVDVAVNTGGSGWYGASVPEFLDFERELSTVQGLAGYTTGTRTVGDSLQPRRVSVAFVTHGFFPTLAAPPLLGRHFMPEEDLPASSVAVLLSEGYWRQDYGAAPDIVGTTIQVGNGNAEVVGVMPESFTFPSPQTEMWFAFRMNRDAPSPRSNHFVNMVGRLAPGRTVDQAHAEVTALTARSREEYPENYSERGFRSRVIPLHEFVVGDAGRAIGVAFGAVLLVLLIACVNVANLLLSRGDRRSREVAIRTAIGAGRGRITAQLLLENGLLAGLGGVVGIGIGWVGVRTLVAVAPAGAPRMENITLSPEVLLFSAGLILACGLLCGLWPAVQASRVSLRSTLTEGGRGGSGRTRQAARQALVGSQVALAAALVLGAGVMIRSLDNLYAVDRGFSGEGVVTFRLDLPSDQYPDAASRVAFYDRVVEGLESQPTVVAAAAAARLPLFNNYAQWTLALDGVPRPGIGAAPDGRAQVSTPGYFDVMKIRPVQGRLYDRNDAAGAPPVAVVNQAMARSLWPGQAPIGQRFKMWAEGWPLIEVVGVIPDVKELRIDEPAAPRFYVPYAQAGVSAYQTPTGMYVVAETTGEPLDLVPTLRRVVADVDPTVPVSRVRTMADIMATSLGTQRFAEMLLKLFAVVAVLLACVGVYGVLSVSVGQRIPEIGLRKALGAQSSNVLRTVLRESALMTLVGGAVGILVGIVATRFMGSLLFDVSGADPFTLAAVALVIGGTAILASLIPALRASNVHPMVALKGD